MFISKSAAETEAAGARCAENLSAGDIVALAGELGAGKTQFVKGMARALSYAGAVTSPTFTLIHEYGGGRLPLYHFDFYRLEKAEALRSIDFEEYVFSGAGVSVIEWADKFPFAIPRSARWIQFKIISEDVRRIETGAQPSPLTLGED